MACGSSILYQNHHSSKFSTMAPAQSINEQNAEKLRSALWYSVGQTVDAVSIEQDLNATPHFIGALSEMLWAQIGMYHAHVYSRVSVSHALISRNRERITRPRILCATCWTLDHQYQGRRAACQTEQWS